MKKCPVCGVEHSDIVPVCSICGSSLANAETIPDKEEAVEQVTSEPERPVTQEPAELPKEKSKDLPDFSMADIQAAVSSVVNSAVEQDMHDKNAPTELDPFDDDSPFVENVMKEKRQKQTQQAAPAEKSGAQQKAEAAKPSSQRNASRKPAQEKKEPAKTERPQKPRKTTAARKPTAKQQQMKPDTQPKPSKPNAAQPKAASQVLDTTAVAAASAQKVRAAKENAVAARERNAQTEEQVSNGIDWSERKHKRNQSKTNTPVIAAACALLALLIVAMLFLLGKMIIGDGTDDNQANNDGQNTVDTLNPDEEEGQNTDDNTVPEDPNGDAENQEGTTLPENDPNAEDQTGDNTTDPDANAQENPDGQDGQNPEENAEEQPQDNTQDQQENEQPELPAITEANETVYATGSVRVRDYPSTQYGNVINSLAQGQSVTRTGTTSTGWSRVEINGTVGYVSSNYLSTTKPSTDSGDDDDAVAYTTAGVNVRETPNGTVIGTLPQGQKVTLTGKKEGGWVQIQTGSLTGYVYQSYLSSSPNGGTDDSQKDDDDVKITETNDTVYATAAVNVRDYPSASNSNVLTVLSKGQKVTRIGKTSTGWSKIKVGSITGYVANSYLSTSKDDGDSGSGQRTGYILPESNTRKYSKSELSALSASKLRLARNEIYARHGRKFNDKSLQDYFNSCTWYSGTIDPATFDANINSYLNSYELANLQLITELEG